jgi:hypothetical protein
MCGAVQYLARTSGEPPAPLQQPSDQPMQEPIRRPAAGGYDGEVPRQHHLV